jgi:SAM-dependent methyltransferase
MREHAENWEEHAQDDPLWAILSADDKRGRQWDLLDFFQTGEDIIDWLMREAAHRGAAPGPGSAMDFGCGVGRLTQALANHFDRVTGVDVSPTMVEIAKRLNFNGDRVQFLLNQRDDLRALPDSSLDCIVSLITLQHVPPETAHKYLVEFLRILRPGGVLLFQLPAGRRVGAPPGEELEPMAAAAYRAEIEILEAPGTLPPGGEATLRLRVSNASTIAWEPDVIARAQIDTHWMAGDNSWKVSKFSEIDVGNHWILPDGAVAIADDGRTTLPAVLGPGEQAEVGLRIKAPDQVGRYECEIDLVQERVSWFNDQGSETARCPITVTEPGIMGRLSLLTATVVGALAGRSSARRGADVPGPREHDLEQQLEDAGTATVWKQLIQQMPESQTPPAPYAMFGTPRDEIIDLLRAHGGETIGTDEDMSCGFEWESHTYFVRRRQS